MSRRKVLFLKSVAYGNLNEKIKEYLDKYKDSDTVLEVRNIQKGPNIWNISIIRH